MEMHVGSVDEADNEQGIAHMIEHVAFLGSKKREKLLGTGARSNAYTDFHHTVFHVHSPVTAQGSQEPLLPLVLEALHEVYFLTLVLGYGMIGICRHEFKTSAIPFPLNEEHFIILLKALSIILPYCVRDLSTGFAGYRGVPTFFCVGLRSF